MRFFVAGDPKSKGSKSLMRTKGGRYLMIESNANALRKWMKAIAQHAQLACDKRIEGPVLLKCAFYFRRPKTVKKRKLPHVKPDLDKLLRAVNDALQGIAFADDSQVTTIVSHKFYADGPSCEAGVLISLASDEQEEKL